MKTNIKKRTSVCSAFLFFFVTMMFISGPLDAFAASKSNGNPTKLKAVGTGADSVKISWNKAKNPLDGYALFRNNKLLARLGKKNSSCLDTGLIPKTKYKYQVKAYKKKVIKTKLWFNKATKKWQKKKPQKKHRGRSKIQKTVKYTYLKPSNIIIVRIAPIPKGKESASAKPKIHTVTFLYGTKTFAEPVYHGDNAIPPTDTFVPGYIFGGWVGNLFNITEDRIILGLYSIE